VEGCYLCSAIECLLCVHDVIVARVLKRERINKLEESISKGARVTTGCNGGPHAATPEEERLQKEKTSRL
jgi:hypothetical protein